jgi:hypothetical protein
LEVEKIRSRVIIFYIMDLDGYSLNQMMRIAGRGNSWWDASADDGQCSSVEKIQEILSKARNDQEDLWKTIVTSSTWYSSSAFEEPVASTSSGDHDQVRQVEAAACNGAQLVISRDQLNIPRRISRPLMTAETENSLDWSLRRMEEFNAAASGSQTSACPSTLPITLEEVPSQQPAMRLHHPSLQLGVHGMISKLELQPPLSPRLLQRTGPHFSRNPVSACNSQSNIPATTWTALAAAGTSIAEHSSLMAILNTSFALDLLRIRRKYLLLLYNFSSNRRLQQAVNLSKDLIKSHQCKNCTRIRCLNKSLIGDPNDLPALQADFSLGNFV